MRANPNLFGITVIFTTHKSSSMSGKELDLRDLAPPQRHPRIHEAFEELESGETLTIINDHEPKPLYYEMKEEVEDFDADRYDVSQEGPQKFIAELPKK